LGVNAVGMPYAAGLVSTFMVTESWLLHPLVSVPVTT